MKNLSKLLSLVLRHQPEKIGLTLDSSGWVAVSELLEKLRLSGNEIDLNLLEKIVEENDKKRFSFSDDKTKIRANQGHSIDVDLQLKKAVPPVVLYHGTSQDRIASILKSGINKGSRHHVHLSKDTETATKVGSRHGKVVLIEVDSKTMLADGVDFYLSENGVWLTDFVDKKYLNVRG